MVPPLRHRPEDIPRLALHFLQQYQDGNGARPTGLSPAAVSFLMQQPWPGNVRELRNAIYRAAALADGAAVLDTAHFRAALPHTVVREPAAAGGVLPLEATLRKAEAQALLEALKWTGGNREDAARLLQIGVATLYRRLKELRVELAKIGAGSWLR